MPDEEVPEKVARRLALALVEQCVRNTGIEDIHAGIAPASLAGDYSDVIVVTPFGEIPWTKVSRISDDEMKALMIEIVNKVFTFLTHMDDLVALRSSVRWNRPEHDDSLLKIAQRRAVARGHRAPESE